LGRGLIRRFAKVRGDYDSGAKRIGIQAAGPWASRPIAAAFSSYEIADGATRIINEGVNRIEYDEQPAAIEWE